MNGGGLLLFATAAEARPLLQALELPAPTVEGCCPPAPLTGQWRLGITGMGPRAVSRWLRAWAASGPAPALVLGAGVAGCLDRRFEVGEVVAVDRVRRERGGGLRLEGPGGGLPAGALMSVTRPVFGAARRRCLARRAALVDMEGYALAAGCRRLRWPCRLLKVVSDHADDRRTLRRNLGPVSRLLAGVLMGVLRAPMPKPEER